MSAKIRELKDKDGTKIYPVTSADGVYLPNGTDTVGRVLGDMRDQNTEITFGLNTVEKDLASGNRVVTTFNDDQTIVEITYDPDDKVISTKTTTINADGSISIEIS